MIETIVQVLEAACLGLGCFLLGMMVQERVSRSGPANRPIERSRCRWPRSTSTMRNAGPMHAAGRAVILTEQEAATKACVRSGAAAFAPGPMPDANTVAVWRCVGSRCMAWRWWIPAGDMLPKGVSPGFGFCGLAGVVGKP
jgi:hypothetical protein